MIVLIIGNYGVGKDTFANMMLTHFGIDTAQMIRSHTTRKPRYENEITHTFKTVKDYKDDKRNDLIVAETKIDGEYYWSTIDQFWCIPECFSIYVTDKQGLQQVIESKIDDFYIIEVVRPSWMIDVDEDRKNREVPETDFKYTVNYRVINDKTFEYLDHVANDVCNMLMDSVEAKNEDMPS